MVNEPLLALSRVSDGDIVIRLLPLSSQGCELQLAFRRAPCCKLIATKWSWLWIATCQNDWRPPDFCRHHWKNVKENIQLTQPSWTHGDVWPHQWKHVELFKLPPAFVPLLEPWMFFFLFFLFSCRSGCCLWLLFLRPPCCKKSSPPRLRPVRRN